MSRVLCVLIVVHLLDLCYLVESVSPPEMIIVSWETGMRRETTAPPNTSDESIMDEDAIYPNNGQEDDNGKEEQQYDPNENEREQAVPEGNPEGYTEGNPEGNPEGEEAPVEDRKNEPEYDLAIKDYGPSDGDLSIDIDGYYGSNKNDIPLHAQGSISVEVDGVDFGNQPNKNDQALLKANGDYPDLGSIVVLDSMDVRNYRAEIAAANKADTLGTNAHYYQPDKYLDFGRRFVPHHPDKVARRNKIVETNNNLTPKLAPPEFVLAVAKESAALSAAEPKNYGDETIRKGIQRTGDYWNAVWKEDVDPQILRTKKSKKLDASPTIVRLGDQNIDNTVDDGADPIDVPIRRPIVHPNYHAPSKYHDITLFELATDVPFSAAIRPACLWNNADFGPYNKALATGWGVTDTGSRSQNTAKELQKVSLSLLGNEYCDGLLIDDRNRNWQGFQSGQMCVGELRGGRDTCQLP